MDKLVYTVFEGRNADPLLMNACLQLRKDVFVDEQKCTMEEEIDGLDEEAIHFGVWAPVEQSLRSGLTMSDVKHVSPSQMLDLLPSSELVAQCRIRIVPLEDDGRRVKVKIERVAVGSKFRSLGLGKVLMLLAMQYIREQVPQAAYMMLGAQTHALGFYERLGFVVSSDIYLDARIEHRDMVYVLDS
jgi:predicted GNAT family N-acyltransferase